MCKWPTIVGIGVLLALLLLAGRPGWAQSIRVSAPVRAYAGGVLSAPVGLPREGDQPVLADVATGARVPCQVTAERGEARLWWIARPMAKGETLALRLSFTRGAAEAGTPTVAAAETPRGVEVLLDGALFTRYVFAGVPKPFCYPLIGPGGVALTRAYPMEEVPGEPRDHPHHRSLWFAHGEVNGIDFWTEGPRAGRILHRAFEALESGPVLARVRARSDWLAADGRKTCEDVREIRVYRASPEQRVLDFDLGLIASEGDVELGDTKEGTFAVRVAPALQAQGGRGQILTSEGARGGSAWGKPAAWCDYYAPVGDGVAGIALMDHPANAYHPTHWMVREYGLFAANPFGLRDFAGDRTGKGRCRIARGQELAFRYRVVMHVGAPEQAGIAERCQDYVEPPKVDVTP